jgi:hypothetical protein
MIDVLLNSLLFLSVLAFFAFLAVRKRPLNAAGSLVFKKWWKNNSVRIPSPDCVRVRQKLFLGWKSCAVTLDWQGRQYLLVLQEGACTVIDKISICESNEIKNDVC